jgi:hypothetical protein
MDILTLVLGWFSHWPCISRAFSGELVWFAHLLGEGNNLESILLISLVADLSDSVSLFRMQECRPPSPQDAGMILLSMGDGILTHLSKVSRPNIMNSHPPTSSQILWIETQWAYGLLLLQCVGPQQGRTKGWKSLVAEVGSSITCVGPGWGGLKAGLSGDCQLHRPLSCLWLCISWQLASGGNVPRGSK